MKFWKSLSNLIEETLPEWRDKFLSYKDLKKQLKLIYPKPVEGDRPDKRLRLSVEIAGQDCPDSPGGCTVSEQRGEGQAEEVVANEVTGFVKLLEEEIEKFNSFFVDQEEEYIIRLKVLQDKLAEACNSNEKLMKVGREIVDFHGEMVLLENYSALNYTGLVKILKKYDKRSGALIRLPFIQNVLQQPFFRTDVLNKLVKESESMLDHLFFLNELTTPSEPTKREEEMDNGISNENKERLLKVPDEFAEIKNMENMYMKLTTSALRVLKEIRSGSSTVNMFSLPPLPTNELEEVWKKTPVLEQAAK